MNKLSQINNEFSNLFKDNIDKLNKSSQIISQYRENALDKFYQLGIPTRQNEDYKHTDLKPVFENKHNYYFEQSKINFKIDDIFQCDIPNIDTTTIILLNGWYHNKNGEKLKTLPGGAIIGSLDEASKKYPELFEKHYSKYAKFENDSLVALNSAFAQDGLFLYLPKNSIVEKPIQIINILLSEEALFVQHRNLIIAEENSHAKMVICDHSLSPHKFLTNSVTEGIIGKNAFLDYFKIQNEHNESSQISSAFFQQEANSTLNFNTISLHGGLIRNNINILLNAEFCENNLFGLYLTDKTQHISNHTVVDHVKPNCVSNQVYKGVLDDFASGTFTGKVIVRKDAQHTIAHQSNKNILLTDITKIHSKPHLEIYADDVKCSHGATVGQLDEDAIFYCQARGIAKHEARLLLMYAFANEIVKKITIEPLKERIDDLVNKRLRGELSRCNNCALNCHA